MNTPAQATLRPWVWLGLSIVLGAAAAWALSHGYLNEGALFRWAKISAVLGNPDVRLENLGLLYPHLPMYVLAPFVYLPGLATPFAPYVASVLVGALLLTVWYAHMRARRFARTTALLLVGLVAVHPMFLWATTTGTEKSLSLLVFYLMCFACVRLLRIGDVRSIITLGALLALYFFVDERTIFLFLALLPLLPFLAPLRMLRRSAASSYVLISLPVVVSVLAWIYLNWLFHGDPWLFLTSAESAFVGATRVAADEVWLREFGGLFFAPLGYAALIGTLALPVAGWLLWHLRGRLRLLLGMGILILHPVLAAALATKTNFLGQPIELLFLMLGACMAAVLVLPRTWLRSGHVLTAWFLVSAAGGWLAFSLAPSEEMRQWFGAMRGAAQAQAQAADVRVGRWLALHRRTTLVDDRSAYRVVAARGDTHGLWLPFMHEFKVAERRGAVDADQVLVLDPRHRLARRDRIGQRFPELYAQGQPGYVLALDDPPWRVYRRAGAGEWPP